MPCDVTLDTLLQDSRILVFLCESFEVVDMIDNKR